MMRCRSSALTDVQSERYASRLDSVCGAAMSLGQQCEWMASRLRCRVLFNRLEAERLGKGDQLNGLLVNDLLGEIESLKTQAENVTHSLGVLAVEAEPAPEPVAPSVVWNESEQKGDIDMRRGQDDNMHDPTSLELKLSALTIPDDVSFFVFRDAAIQTSGNTQWEDEYESWATDWLGFVPHRVHNLAANNPYGYPAGPECCQNLPAFPPFLFQWQIDAINNCADFVTVVMAGDKFRQALRGAV